MIAALFATLAAAAAAPLPQAAPAALPSDPVEADWRAIPDDELLVMTLAGGRRVLIRLAPGYAPEHVANVRRLALARWWDAASVYRVQENWVAQWGDATEKKPLPPGIAARPAAEFDLSAFRPAIRLRVSDAYSRTSGITADGWAIASGRPGTAEATGAGWMAHCYGTVGVARDASPDTGTGAELFMPIGGSARRLDRNYTIVGRVIEGAPLLSGLPRSDAPMGMYATEGERLPIISVRLASDMPAASRPKYQYRAADNVRFAAMVALRENPKPPMIGLGGVDVCDVPLATRPAP
ncbi:peptidylprolyl isomerase [Sphingomonas gellani]|uniref:Peptidylprolyl isomerase n=1 Tax=Sphingomonas gellani TaxID=1166340 RepID=A0A1H8CPG9_9SPHN|nr:peptidylprolyl isomerase [Sphingomonas gellani]SEM96799.1 peptidylprolyl isomerase [Sphingomonas gellani]